MAPPRHPLPGHQPQGLRHRPPPHSSTRGPNPAGSELPRARPVATRNTIPTQPTQSPPPGHAPLVAQCWLLPVRPPRPWPSPRPQPLPHTPELLRAARASFVPTHPAPDSRHIAAVPEVSGPGLERGAPPTSPPTSGCNCPLDEGRPLTCTPPVPQTPQQEVLELYLLG